MERYFLGKNGFVWFVGVVEDRNDPLQVGRVRVRCFGWHTEDKELIPTAALPWAQIVTPTNLPAAYTCLQGDYVLGFFLDGDEAQLPMIIGVIPGIPESKPDTSVGFSDPAGFFPKNVGEPTFTPLARGKKYPNSWVLETVAGHVFELNDNVIKKGQVGPIILKHSTGTQVQMLPDGSRVDIITKNNVVKVGKNNTIEVAKDCSIAVGGDCSFSVAGDFSVSADSISMVAKDSFTADAKGSCSLHGGALSGTLTLTDITSVLDHKVITTVQNPLTSISLSPLGASMDGGVGGVDINCIPAPKAPTFFDKVSAKFAEIKGKIDAKLTELKISLITSDLGIGIGKALGEVKKGLDEFQKGYRKMQEEMRTTQLAISQRLQPFTEIVNRISNLIQAADQFVRDMSQAIAPVERILGKELFPHSEYYDNVFSELNSYESQIDRLFDPLRLLNDTVVEINQEFDLSVERYDVPEDIAREPYAALNTLNSTVHYYNQFYNLSAPSTKQIENLGARLQAFLPPNSQISTEFPEIANYDFFRLNLTVFGTDLFGEDSVDPVYRPLDIELENKRDLAEIARIEAVVDEIEREERGE